MEVDEVTAIYPKNTQDISFRLYNTRQVDQTIPYYVLSEGEILVFGQTPHIAAAEPLGIKSELIQARCVAFNVETFQYLSGERNVYTLYLSHDRHVQHG